MPFSSDSQAMGKNGRNSLNFAPLGESRFWDWNFHKAERDKGLTLIRVAIMVAAALVVVPVPVVPQMKNWRRKLSPNGEESIGANPYLMLRHQ